MPELAAIFTIGLFCSLLLTLTHYFMVARKVNSAGWIQLQKNLILIGSYWSEARGALEKHEAGLVELDLQRFYRQIWILGGLLVMLSWLGFFLQILIIISLRYFLRSRTELKLFNSILVEQDLTADQVRATLKDLFIEAS